MNNEPNQPVPVAPFSEPPKPTRKHRWLRVILTGVITLVLSGVILFVVPRVIDVVRARNFNASAEIAAIDKRLKLTDRGTTIFYASTPQIDERTTFNQHCQSEERTAAILGCFYQDKIYLYDLQNEELDGTLEVTAAHEMLHAAYQRLSLVEKWWVDQKIVAEYEKVKNDPDVQELMSYYTQAEPGREVNELHSILGTIMTTLSPDLENYYNQYFEDRGSVVSLNQRYNEVFAQLQEKTDEIEARLSAAEPVITRLIASYDADRTQLEADIASFNAKAKANKFTSMDEFYAERSALLARIDALNAKRDEINAKISAYNKDVAALNEVSVHANELYQSMNGVDSTESIQ